jgi:hypothetical protein
VSVDQFAADSPAMLVERERQIVTYVPLVAEWQRVTHRLLAARVAVAFTALEGRLPTAEVRRLLGALDEAT